MTSYVFPGQGSQQKGMGKDLFDQFPELEQQASAILGYSVKELCLKGPVSQLSQTQFTQPCLFFVSALQFLHFQEREQHVPSFMAGHSLGEYSALFAAGAFDLSTGLKMVQERGRLMSQAKKGAMAAVLGRNGDEVRNILTDLGASTIDIANYNSSTQTVISGLAEDIHRLASDFETYSGIRYIPLPVSAAFHSRYMQEAADQFSSFISPLTMSPLKIPVIANVTARQYPENDSAYLKATLAKQIVSPVKWTETVRFLMGKQQKSFVEVGPGNVLTKLVDSIQEEETPLIIDEDTKESSAETVNSTVISQGLLGSKISSQEPLPASPISPNVVQGIVANTTQNVKPIKDVVAESQKPQSIDAEDLGSNEFKNDYGLKFAYVAGSMYKGIASTDMVIAMGKAGLLGFLGTGGMRFEEVEESIGTIQSSLSRGEAYGINLLNNIDQPEMEEELVKLYLQRGIRIIEASAFMHITPALVLFRFNGAKKLPSGEVHTPNAIFAKVSRPEIAEQFMSPAPTKILQQLKQRGLLTDEEIQCAAQTPVSRDICVESDSGGHTDKGVAYTLLPAIQIIRDQVMETNNYTKMIRVGAAGGLGTPESAASAFMLGADFILTGSINQCTVEAGTSDQVKDLLQSAGVSDTAYAPSGDMFELGAQIQVLKKGLFFPARANKLFELYRQYNSIEELDEKTQQQLKSKFFKRSVDDVWNETASYYRKNNPSELEKAEQNAKTKMALIFKWYFVHTSRLALSGSKEQKVDYQIHCGPAMGAFNQWVKGSLLENWRNRHVDKIAEKIMTATAVLLVERFHQMTNNKLTTEVDRGKKSA